VTIVYATDFSASARPAEEQAVYLARAFGDDLVFVHVATESPIYGEGGLGIGDVQAVYDAQRRWASDALTACVAAAREAGVRARFSLRVGVPAEEIIAAAEEEKARMIVIGTHGRSGLDRLLLGSVAERVIRRASCPVVTVRPPDP
jgi:nucleotide-binding universal stress UspA family protein